MSKIKLNLARLTIPEKIALAQQIVTALTGNANFATPHPSLASVTTAGNNLNAAFTAAQAARSEAKNKTTIQTQLEEELDGNLSQLANYARQCMRPARRTRAGYRVAAHRTDVQRPWRDPTTKLGP